MDSNKMKIRYFFLAGFIFVVLSTVLAVPAVWIALAGNSSTFDVSLTLNNALPSITEVAAVSTSPSEGTTKVVSFQFNATDSNGVADIPAANANVSITQGAVTLNASSCDATALSSTKNEYTCNITINYYHLPGTWDINASIFDGASASDYDATTADLTMGTTYGIDLDVGTLTFSGDPGDSDVNASNAPQVVNNKGNAAFSYLELKAYDLVDGSNNVGAGNFTAGASSNPASGIVLVNNTDVNLTTATSVAVEGSRNLWVYLDIPAGTPDGSYTASSLWVVTAS